MFCMLLTSLCDIDMYIPHFFYLEFRHSFLTVLRTIKPCSIRVRIHLLIFRSLITRTHACMNFVPTARHRYHSLPLHHLHWVRTSSVHLLPPDYCSPPPEIPPDYRSPPPEIPPDFVPVLWTSSGLPSDHRLYLRTPWVEPIAPADPHT